MTTTVNSPFEVFTDSDGTPLDNGYLYIGTANQNPESNPVSVYWDSELTIPAASPIRTINGYPSRNGSPSQFFVSADDYSIILRDNNFVLVFSSLNAQSRFSASLIYADDSSSGSIFTTVQGFINKILSSAGASLIGFIQAGVGAVATTMQTKMRRVSVDAVDFGAVADGITDDATAITAAITAVTAGGGVVKLTGHTAVNSAITIPNGVTLDFQWYSVVPLSDVDMFYVNQGGQIKNCRANCVSQTAYSSIVAKYVPTANVQGDRFIPWLDGFYVQFYSSGAGKGTGVYYDASEYYIQLTQANNVSVRYGEYGVRMVGGDEALEYCNGNAINGYTNFRSTYSIHAGDKCDGNVINGVVLQGSPDGAIILTGNRNKISGIAWDDVSATTAGDGNDLSDLIGTTQYGLTLTDTARETRTRSRGSAYYDYTSINAYDDARHEFRGPGKLEFRDLLVGGKDPRWTETLTGTGAVAYSAAEFGNATGFKAWLPYAEFTCPQGSNNVLWNFNGRAIVRSDQNPKVHFTNYTATGDDRGLWEIGLYTDANNYILLRQDFEAYTDDDIRLVTCAGGTATTEVLSTSGTGRINFCTLLITDSLVTAMVKQYNNAGTGSTGRVSDGAYWNGGEVTATSSTNIPTGNLEPRVFVDHGAAANANSAVMRLMDYQLIAGRKSAS